MNLYKLNEYSRLFEDSIAFAEMMTFALKFVILYT